MSRGNIFLPYQTYATACQSVGVWYYTNAVSPGACGEGCHPWGHFGGGGEQDEGCSRLQNGIESRCWPFHEICGCFSHYTQHLRCKYWKRTSVCINLERCRIEKKLYFHLLTDSRLVIWWKRSSRILVHGWEPPSSETEKGGAGIPLPRQPNWVQVWSVAQLQDGQYYTHVLWPETCSGGGCWKL